MRNLTALNTTTLLALFSLAIMIRTTYAEEDCNDTPCKNSGVCKKGAKDYTKAKDYLPPTVVTQVLEVDEGTEDAYGNYCDCGEDNLTTKGSGFTGLYCEIEYEICPDDNVCFHGAPCLEDYLRSDEYVCGCPYASVANEIVGGKHCEFTADKFCDTRDETDDGTDLAGSKMDWYCFNGATCKAGADVAPVNKCDCGTSGTWYGLHCELVEDENCEVICQNGGTCKHGTKDYSDLPTSMQDYFEQYKGSKHHCVCPKGYTGQFCEISKDECGNGHCYHGADCALGLSPSGGEFTYCKCNAFQMTENGDYSQIAGEFCEKKHTKMCPAPPGFDPLDYFCVNDGECPVDSHGYCKCDANHSGPRCEFEVESEKECTLDCFNGGKCFFGEAGTTPHDVYDFNNAVTGNQKDNMHCKCPLGYAGENCGILINHCGETPGQHACLNGGECVNNNDEFTCNCAATQNDGLGVAFAGAACEYAATVFCGGDFAGIHSFCTNNGECKGDVTKEGFHPGCECDDGYTGEYCEIKETRKRTNKASTAVLAFSLSLLVVVIIGGSYMYVKVGRKDLCCAYSRQAPEPPQYYSDNTMNMDNRREITPIPADDDDEEYEMKDVEII